MRGSSFLTKLSFTEKKYNTVLEILKRSPSKTARKKSTDWFERNFIEMSNAQFVAFSLNKSKHSSSSTLDQISRFPSDGVPNIKRPKKQTKSRR